MLPPVIAGQAHDRRLWYVVAALMLLAALLRFHNLGEEGGLWLDEAWTVMNAAGKGRAMDRLSPGELQRPGADWTEVGSVSWTAIWPNTASDVHPPGFYLLVRAWIAAFGDSDFAVRSIAVLFALAAMPVMYVLARDTVGPGRALAALACYAVSCGAIFFSQECRSYTLLQFWLVCLAWTCWRIAARGATQRRLAAMGGLLLASALTHYFFFGAAAGLVVWTLINGRREDRVKVVLAALCAAVVFAVAWGPFLWAQRHFWGWKDHLVDGPRTVVTLAMRVLAVPARMVLPNAAVASPWTQLVGAVVLIAIPALAWRARPDLRRGVTLWWAFLVGGTAFLLFADVAHHGLSLEVPRYTTQLTPALCVIVVSIFASPRWPAAAGRAYLAAGAVFVALSSYWARTYAYNPKAFWRDEVVRAYVPRMQPGDVIVFHSDRPDDWRPKMQYLCLSRYEGPARQLAHVVMLGDGVATGPAEAAIARAPNVWVFSLRPPNEPPPHIGALEERAVFPIRALTAEMPLSLRVMSPATRPAR